MDKAIIIQDEIRTKLRDLAKANPSFELSSEKLNILLYKLRSEDLESYKSTELQNIANERFQSVVDLLNQSVHKREVSNIQAHGLVVRIGDMRQADFDYLINDYLPRISSSFKNIDTSFRQIEQTFTNSSENQIETKEKNKFRKFIDLVFRKSDQEEVNKNRIKLK